MRSMKYPLGRIDTRLTSSMTDTLMDDEIHSPSFASLAPMNDMDYGNQGMEETDPRLASRSRRPGTRCPRLELDVAMDKYHTLDGFTEPLNPQNTPASHTHSDSGSPQSTCRRIKTESLRVNSAPQALYIDWRPPDSSLSLFDNDCLLGCQPRCFSADDEPRSNTPLAPTKRSNEASGSHPTGSLADIISTARCVRFTPPTSSPVRLPRPTQDLLPSTERNKDYIATFRQQKRFDKWRVASRVRSQRLSPHRNPRMSAQAVSKHLNVVPGDCPSSPKPLPHQDEHPISDLQLQEIPEALIHPEETMTNSHHQPQIFDMVAVSFSLHRVRNSNKHFGSGRRPVNLQLSYSLRPIHQGEEARNVLAGSEMNDLLLCTFFIVPAFLLRVPLAILHTLNRLAHTRSGLAALFILRLLWSIAIEFITPVLAKLGMDAILSDLGPK